MRVALARILVALGFSAPVFAQGVAVRVDKAIETKSPGKFSPVADDAEFVRRVYLDLAGRIPTADEARRFLADKDAGKRTKVIDRLLNSPEFPRRMREALTVMLLERRAGRTISDPQWNSFLETAFRENRPWDKVVAQILAADGFDEKTAAGMRFFVDGGRSDPNQMTRDLGRLFLGMDLQCAQCHDHPNVAAYKQSHYFGLLAFVKNSRLQGKHFVATPDAKKLEFQSVFIPDVKKSTGPRLPGGSEVAVPVFGKKPDALAKPAAKGVPAIPRFRPRLLLAKQLASAQNERFVQASVNRFWFLMMGRGLVHPLDLMHKDNPASHPEVLKLLSKEFVAHRFDVKWLIRELALSRTYQRSSRLPVDVAAKDIEPKHYRVAIAKPLSAEQMAWSLMHATGAAKSIAATPRPKDSKFTVKDYINGRIPAPANLPDVMTLFAGIYGNPPGEAEVEFNPSSEHALFLMNDKIVYDWLKPRAGGTIERLSRIEGAHSVADELYLTVLSRVPIEEERKAVASYLDEQKANRVAAVTDLFWALLASNEFRLNH